METPPREEHAPEEPPAEDDYRALALPELPARPGAQETCRLVLEARGIPFRSVPGPDGPRLEVPRRWHQQAQRELARYAEENRGWPPVLPTPAREADNTETTALILALVGLFHVLVHGGFADLGISGADWISRGLADAGRILEGEWWRPVTALTLHADGQHVLANLLLGLPLVVRLCRRYGSGPGWALILASGVLGNLTNALVQSPDHRSLGASTALFGALGIFGGIALVRGRAARVPRWLLPVAAALALLALFGAGNGDANVDVEAHLFGFGWGFILGALLARLRPGRGRPGAGWNALLSAATAAVVVGAWAAALSAG